MSIGNSERLQADPLDQRCDVAIAANVQKDPHLQLSFRQDHLIPFVDRSHAWARRRRVKLEELTGMRPILREPASTTRQCFDAAIAAAGIQIGEVLEIGSREAIREAVAMDFGIGIVAASEFGDDMRLKAWNSRARSSARPNSPPASATGARHPGQSLPGHRARREAASLGGIDDQGPALLCVSAPWQIGSAAANRPRGSAISIRTPTSGHDDADQRPSPSSARPMDTRPSSLEGAGLSHHPLPTSTVIRSSLPSTGSATNS